LQVSETPFGRIEVTKELGFNLNDGYQVTPRPRWGHGLAPHPLLQAVLERGRADYKQVLDGLDEHRQFLHRIRHDRSLSDPIAPFWNNIWFTAIDAAVLVGLLLARKPRRYIEIGSGHSTMFAAHAIRSGSLPTKISSIDPRPRANIESLCGRIIRAPLENCHLGLFDELEAGDIVFYDGSHRVFQNSDTTVFFLDVLPRLKPGVLVHVHDIFLPADYPPEWAVTLFSEQYLLAAMLLWGSAPFRVVFPSYFVCMDPELDVRVRKILQAESPDRNIPYHYKNAGTTPGSSFWFETLATRHGSYGERTI
jgi:hypothetical protein